MGDILTIWRMIWVGDSVYVLGPFIIDWQRSLPPRKMRLDEEVRTGYVSRSGIRAGDRDALAKAVLVCD